MRILNTAFAAAAFASLLGNSSFVAAFAQDSSAHSGHGATSSFPEACRAPGGGAGSQAAPHAEMDMSNIQAHQRAAMEGMATMDRDMMQGMMAEDADVAFICGMIAHHQGAIDMAKVELEHGDDAWAKEMAQKVIDAQTQEIGDMTKWLENNAH